MQSHIIVAEHSRRRELVVMLVLFFLQVVKIKMEHSRLNGEATVQEAVAEVAAIMGENVRLRRGFTMSSSTGIVSSYLHASQHPGLL
jgi:translation elongation factor EF-Ts